MSPRAIVFVEQWIDERVQPGVYHDEEGPDARTAHLVEQLMLDADSAGIPQEEIEQEYPDLFGDVARAMGNAPDPAQVVDDKQALKDEISPLSQRIEVLEMWKQDLEIELGEISAGGVVVKRNTEDVTDRVRRRLEFDLSRIQALLDTLRRPAS